MLYRLDLAQAGKHKQMKAVFGFRRHGPTPDRAGS